MFRVRRRAFDLPSPSSPFAPSLLCCSDRRPFDVPSPSAILDLPSSPPPPPCGSPQACMWLVCGLYVATLCGTFLGPQLCQDGTLRPPPVTPANQAALV